MTKTRVPIYRENRRTYGPVLLSAAKTVATMMKIRPPISNQPQTHAHTDRQTDTYTQACPFIHREIAHFRTDASINLLIESYLVMKLYEISEILYWSTRANSCCCRENWLPFFLSQLTRALRRSKSTSEKQSLRTEKSFAERIFLCCMRCSKSWSLFLFPDSRCSLEQRHFSVLSFSSTMFNNLSPFLFRVSSRVVKI